MNNFKPKKTVKKHKNIIKKPKNTQKSDVFTQICKKELSVEVIKEYQFHPVRKWRFDYAIPEHKIALEVEGGVWTEGRHTRGVGFLKDIEKYNTGTLLGWRIFRTTPSELLSSNTIDLLKEAIKSGQI